MKKFFLIIWATTQICACGHYASNGENLYKKSQNGPKLTVPSPLTASNLNHFYDLPNNSNLAPISIEPPIVSVVA